MCPQWSHLRSAVVTGTICGQVCSVGPLGPVETLVSVVPSGCNGSIWFHFGSRDGWVGNATATEKVIFIKKNSQFFRQNPPSGRVLLRCCVLSHAPSAWASVASPLHSWTLASLGVPVHYSTSDGSLGMGLGRPTRSTRFHPLRHGPPWAPAPFHSLSLHYPRAIGPSLLSLTPVSHPPSARASVA